jgi:hypothetical protein
LGKYILCFKSNIPITLLKQLTEYYALILRKIGTDSDLKKLFCHFVEVDASVIRNLTESDNYEECRLLRCDRMALVRTGVFLRSILRLLDTANVSSSPILVTLMMEAICSSEMLVPIRATRRNIPDDGIIRSYGSKNLKFS